MASDRLSALFAAKWNAAIRQFNNISRQDEYRAV
jgi:hypothetical protein